MPLLPPVDPTLGGHKRGGVGGAGGGSWVGFSQLGSLGLEDGPRDGDTFGSLGHKPIKQGSVVDFLRDLNLKDAIQLLSKAWSEVSGESIRSTWDRAFGNLFHGEVEDNEEAIFQGFSDQDIQEAQEKVSALLEEHEDFQGFLESWCAQDDDLPVVPPTCSEDFLDSPDTQDPEEEAEEEEEEEEEDSSPVRPRITTSQCLEWAQGMLHYYEQEGDELMATQKTTEILNLKPKLSNSKKQQKLTSYFKK